MKKKLSEIIKELEDKNAIADYFLHRNYDNGEFELNIEFNNEVADDTLNDSGIRTVEACAYWE